MNYNKNIKSILSFIKKADDAKKSYDIGDDEPSTKSETEVQPKVQPKVQPVKQPPTSEKSNETSRFDISNEDNSNSSNKTPPVKSKHRLDITDEGESNLPKTNESYTKPTTQYKSVITDAIASKAVKQMQIAMQELAKSVTIDAESATMFRKPQDAKQQLATESVKNSKKYFNDFIAENFMGDLPDEQTGVEWSKDPSIATYNAKKPGQTDIYELDVVMDTIKRIGQEKSEFKPDGIWSWRTNNALKNMLGFSYALLQLEGELGLSDNRFYTTSDWKNFTKDLAGYEVIDNVVKLTPEQKRVRALRITNYLGKITKLYNHFRLQVTSSPKFRPYIEGNKGLFTYSRSGTNPDVLNEDEIRYSNLQTPKVEGLKYSLGQVNKTMTYIPLKALTSKEEYIKWMNSIGVTSEPLAIRIFNQAIKPQIDRVRIIPRQFAKAPQG